MAILVIGMAVFLSVHLIPTWPGLRQRLVARLGDKAYRAAFALVSLVGFLLIVWGMARAEHIALWETPAWGAEATLLLMLPSVSLLAAKGLPTNLKRFTRHPMSWGVVLWSVAHLLSNGDLASLILFGGFGLYALYDMASANRRGATKSTQRYPVAKDLLVLAAGVAGYVSLIYLHPYLFGAAVFDQIGD